MGRFVVCSRGEVEDSGEACTFPEAVLLLGRTQRRVDALVPVT